MIDDKPSVAEYVMVPGYECSCGQRYGIDEVQPDDRCGGCGGALEQKLLQAVMLTDGSGPFIVVESCHRCAGGGPV